MIRGAVDTTVKSSHLLSIMWERLEQMVGAPMVWDSQRLLVDVNHVRSEEGLDQAIRTFFEGEDPQDTFGMSRSEACTIPGTKLNPENQHLCRWTIGRG
jgi:hypothetical protein